MATVSPGTKALAGMWRAILWIVFATGAMIFISLKARDGRSYLFVWGLLKPRLFIGTMFTLGLFEMTFSYVRGRRISDPTDRTRLRITTALSLAALTVAAISCVAAWQHAAPLWSAVETLSRGDDAAARLKSIAERHAATMEKGVVGPAALKSWKESADGALPLRPDFAAAVEAAKYLETAATGTLKVRAGIDAQFYGICLEWVDLYALVSRKMTEESMSEPPEEWATKQNTLVDRIEALPPLPKEGS